MSLPFLLLQVFYSNTPEWGLWSYKAFSWTCKHTKLLKETRILETVLLYGVQVKNKLKKKKLILDKA